MNLKEMLEEGRMLRQQDRDSAFDYYEQQRQRAAVSQDRELWLASTATLAWELLERGQSDGGLIEQAITVAEPDYPYLLLARGRLLMAEGRFQSALDLLQTPTTTDDLQLQGLLADSIACCLSIAHQFDRAKSYFDRAIALLSPDSFYLGFVYIHLGEMHLRMQNFHQSEEDAQNALEIAIKTEDGLLRFWALVLLTKIAIRNDRMEIAHALIEDSQELIDPDIDRLEVAHLLLLQIELLCQEGDITSALAMEEHLAPRLTKLNDWQTKQQAKYLEGKIEVGKIAEGLVGLNEDTIERLEDILLDVALQYEERQMYSSQALVLLEVARLYFFALKLTTPYQFQGKSLRSLEQAGELLKQVGLKDTALGQEVEQLYDQMLDQLSSLN